MESVKACLYPISPVDGIEGPPAQDAEVPHPRGGGPERLEAGVSFPRPPAREDEGGKRKWSKADNPEVGSLPWV